MRLEHLEAPGTIEDVGAKTVALRFEGPTLEYEELFQWIVPKHAVEGTDYCEDWNKVMWPAAGPFVVDEWQRGESLRLSRNPNYWKVDAETGERLPYLDAVEFRFIWEAEKIIRAFKTREVQVIQPPPAPETINSLKTLASEGAEVQALSGPVWEHMNFQFGPGNRNPDSLNRFVEYRQAVAYGLDLRQLFDNIGYPLLQPTYGFIQHFTPSASSEPWLQYDYDPVMVFSTTSNADLRPRLADGLVDMLAEIGIEVRLELEDSQLFSGETLDSGNWDVGEWAWVGTPGLQGLVSLFALFDPDGPPPDGSNIYRWCTPDSIVRDDEAVAEFRELFAAMRDSVARDEILAGEVVVIPLNARLVVGAV